MVLSISKWGYNPTYRAPLTPLNKWLGARFVETSLSPNCLLLDSFHHVPFFVQPHPLVEQQETPLFFNLRVGVAKGVGESQGVETGGETEVGKNAGFGLQP